MDTQTRPLSTPAPADDALIRDSDALAAFCADIAHAPYMALDTEFLRVSTYWPKLCLIQIATQDHAPVLIDPLHPDLDMAPLFALLEDTGLVKIFHSARQDIEIIYRLRGRVPLPLFDTQIAAMACGFGDAVAYETLARQILGVRVDKSSRVSDWSRRPLSPEQTAYARGDVAHLCEIYRILSRQLEETGRLSWIEDEINALCAPALYEAAPEEAWRRVRTRFKSQKKQALLMAAAAWREVEAQRRDVPRGRVLRDECLCEVVERAPKTQDALKAIPTLPRGFAHSPLSAGLLEALKNPPRGALPPPPPPQRKAQAESVDMLKLLLKCQCRAHKVAPKLIASAQEIGQIPENGLAGTRLARGFRYEVFGRHAEALLKGKEALALNAEGGLLLLPASRPF